MMPTWTSNLMSTLNGVAIGVLLVVALEATGSVPEPPVEEVAVQQRVIDEVVESRKLEPVPDAELDSWFAGQEFEQLQAQIFEGFAPPLDSGDEVSLQPAPESLSQYVHILTRGNARGSAVSIGDGWFVTCAHVVNAAGGQIAINGTSVRATIHTSPAHVDVALLQTDLKLPGVEISTEWVEHLSDAVVVGYPGLEPETTAATGIVADFDVVALGTDQPPVRHGQSGGGVFVNGKLVGVLRGFTRGDDIPANPHAAKYTAFALAKRHISQLSAHDAPYNSGAGVPEPPASEADRPRITIISPPDWHCPHCETMKAQDWSGFDVTYEQRDGLTAYPCTEWADKRGVIRRLWGSRSPWQVKWSYEQTMRD